MKQTKKLAELALLATIALTVFIVELRIPNPFPISGVKLELANIVTVIMVYRYRARETAMVLLVRILLGAVFAGNLMALLYSFSGGCLCLAGMLVLRHVIPERTLWFSSVLGAVLHNIGQLSVAALVTRTAAVAAYFPILLVSGCLAGAFTGLCAQSALAALGRTGAFPWLRSPTSKEKQKLAQYSKEYWKDEEL